MNDELKDVYIKISESLGVAVRELEMKATILKNIQTALWHQASSELYADSMYAVNPENLFDIIKNSIKQYQDYK